MNKTRKLDDTFARDEDDDLLDFDKIDSRYATRQPVQKVALKGYFGGDYTSGYSSTLASKAANQLMNTRELDLSFKNPYEVEPQPQELFQSTKMLDANNRARSIEYSSPEQIREKNKRRLEMLEKSFKNDPQFENLVPA